MIKNMIGAAMGSSLAKSTPITGGAAGAAIASAVPFVISRMSIPALITVGVGSYFAKRYFDKRKADQPADEGSKKSIGKTKANKTDDQQNAAAFEGAIVDAAGTSPHSPAIAAV